jgi:uracil-DNA glycosylase
MDFMTWFQAQQNEAWMQSIVSKWQHEDANFSVVPSIENRLNALKITPLDSLKIVIIGQDPYHGEHQAHGLSFSCLTTPLPPSLKNIFKAIQMDGYEVDDQNGDLTRWATQGVLLWNVYLTVRLHEPLSHAWREYEILTQQLLNMISMTQQHVVFLLWGSFAQKFEPFIKGDHFVIKTVHPSPLSAYRGFFHSEQFKKANAYLKSHQKKEVDFK